MKCVNWLVVSANPSFRLFSYAMDIEEMSVFSLEGVACVAHDCKEVLVPRPLLRKVPFL